MASLSSLVVDFIFQFVCIWQTGNESAWIEVQRIPSIFSSKFPSLTLRIRCCSCCHRSCVVGCVGHGVVNNRHVGVGKRRVWLDCDRVAICLLSSCACVVVVCMCCHRVHVLSSCVVVVCYIRVCACVVVVFCMCVHARIVFMLCTHACG